MTMRTFLALDLDEVILDGLQAVAVEMDDPEAKVRWVGRENLHVTLHFLGDVSDAMVCDVCRIAAEAAARTRAFEFEVRGAACVPPRGPLRMIWANVADPAGELATLQGLLATELSGCGLRVENRRYKPHVTLARINHARDPNILRKAGERLRDKHFGFQHADEIVAYSSRLTPDGPVYAPLARAALAG